MKKVIIVILLVMVFIGMFYGGLYLFGWYAYNTQSCERFNIDNIELRTGVNIPEVTAIECECTGNKKFSKFVIDTEKVNLDNYILKNDFTLIDDLYIKENDNENSTYKVVFNKQAAELIVDLTYKNK